jgi:glutaredoxin-related protein
MKTCHAGHYPILFEADRCPACEAIERLDKVNLKLQVEIENLKRELSEDTWNGGAC